MCRSSEGQDHSDPKKQVRSYTGNLECIANSYSNYHLILDLQAVVLIESIMLLKENIAYKLNSLLYIIQCLYRMCFRLTHAHQRYQ